MIGVFLWIFLPWTCVGEEGTICTVVVIKGLRSDC